MPFAAERYKREHIISKMLYEKGYTRREMYTWMECTAATLHVWFKRPDKHLTVRQIEIIASKLERPFYEVVALIRGVDRKPARKWADEVETRLKLK